MTPIIERINEKKLVGIKLSISYADYKIGSIIAAHFEVSNHDDTLRGVLSSLLVRLIVGAVAVLVFIWIAH